MVASLLAIRGMFIALSRVDRSVLLTGGYAGVELRTVSILSAVHCGIVALAASHGIKLLSMVVLIEALLFAPTRPLLIHRYLKVPLSAYRGVRRVVLSAAIAGGVTWAVLRVFDIHGPLTYAVVVVLGGAVYVSLVMLLAQRVAHEMRHTLGLLLARRRRPEPPATPYAEALVG
jgi:hypothetical protein